MNNKIFSIKIVLVASLVIWSVAGALWFLWDTAANEMQWSRLPSEETDWGFLKGGPLIWIFAIIVFLIVKLLLWLR